MIYLLLVYEFFKVGLFSVGGGYATLPFLYHIADVYKWYSAEQLVDMLAVSSITPGPVGINVATFAGFKSAGILGSLLATSALILPSFLIVVFIAKLLNKFKENFFVNAILYSIKPAGCALIAAVGVDLFRKDVLKDISSFDVYNLSAFVDIKALILVIGLLILSLKVKKDPLIYLGIAAICGVLFNIKIWS
ncbi:chromate transporter [bacterium]|nr:chromate transporter [bacterium]